MKSWPRKPERTIAAASAEGPLTGAALARLRAASTPQLVEWVDNSLAKIGIVLHESQNGGSGAAGLVAAAEEEAAALLQALREISARVSV